MNRDQLHIKRSKDLERKLTAPRYVQKQELLLALVLSHETLDGALFKYKYQITPALMVTDPASVDYGTIVERHDVAPSPSIAYDAYSISEIGNTSTHAAYGVSLSNLPATVDPVPIPDGTPVIAMANRGDNGEFHYLIINTQALSGTC